MNRWHTRSPMKVREEESSNVQSPKRYSESRMTSKETKCPDMSPTRERMQNQSRDDRITKASRSRSRSHRRRVDRRSQRRSPARGKRDGSCSNREYDRRDGRHHNLPPVEPRSRYPAHRRTPTPENANRRYDRIARSSRKSPDRHHPETDGRSRYQTNRKITPVRSSHNVKERARKSTSSSASDTSPSPKKVLRCTVKELRDGRTVQSFTLEMRPSDDVRSLLRLIYEKLNPDEGRFFVHWLRSETDRVELTSRAADRPTLESLGMDPKCCRLEVTHPKEPSPPKTDKSLLEGGVHGKQVTTRPSLSPTRAGVREKLMALQEEQERKQRKLVNASSSESVPSENTSRSTSASGVKSASVSPSRSRSESTDDGKSARKREARRSDRPLERRRSRGPKEQRDQKRERNAGRHRSLSSHSARADRRRDPRQRRRHDSPDRKDVRRRSPHRSQSRDSWDRRRLAKVDRRRNYSKDRRPPADGGRHCAEPRRGRVASPKQRDHSPRAFAGRRQKRRISSESGDRRDTIRRKGVKHRRCHSTSDSSSSSGSSRSPERRVKASPEQRKKHHARNAKRRSDQSSDN